MIDIKKKDYFANVIFTIIFIFEIVVVGVLSILVFKKECKKERASNKMLMAMMMITSAATIGYSIVFILLVNETTIKDDTI